MSEIHGTLIDANVLLDVATEDPEWGEWSVNALAAAARAGELFINPLIYAEVSIGYQQREDVDRALLPSLYQRADLPFEAAFLASKAFLMYRRRGGARRSPLPDFYIGAHAAVADLDLLTRDGARYRSYFPTVTVLAPATGSADR